MPQRNLAVELLQKLLKGEIATEKFHTNLDNRAPRVVYGSLLS
jgi:hypothetical protein